MRILFVPFGSEGDVNPLLWLAGHLAARGHDAVFLLTPHYGPLAVRRGFEWHPMGTEEDFQRMAGDPALWKPVVGTWRVAAAMRESLGHYRRAFKAAGGRFDLVVTSSFGLAASSLAEAGGIPRLMLHLQPACLRSHRDLPIPAAGAAWLRHAPAFVKKFVFGGVDFFLNRTLLPPLNRFRAKLRLAALGDFYRDALMGAEGVGLLFPSWFAAPQPEWPEGIRQFDFPVSRHAPAPLPSALGEWLRAGEPPVLWTHGSANLHVDRFHALAVQTTALAGGRALLVSRNPPAIPLPANLFHYPHVPFEDLMPFCRAIVHHAGIGTTAKAFAAGIPQVAIPLAHDQHDNAARIERLGAGFDASGRARPAPLSRLLSRAGTDPELAAAVRRCRELASSSPASAEALCRFAEAVAGGVGPGRA